MFRQVSYQSEWTASCSVYSDNPEDAAYLSDDTYNYDDNALVQTTTNGIVKFVFTKTTDSSQTLILPGTVYTIKIKPTKGSGPNKVGGMSYTEFIASTAYKNAADLTDKQTIPNLWPFCRSSYAVGLTWYLIPGVSQYKVDCYDNSDLSNVYISQTLPTDLGAPSSAYPPKDLGGPLCYNYGSIQSTNYTSKIIKYTFGTYDTQK